jgi:hypothetical protein
VLADDGEGQAEPFEDADRLPVLAGRDQDLVPVGLKPLDQWPEDERVGRRRAVDPDPQRELLKRRVFEIAVVAVAVILDVYTRCSRSAFSDD